METRLTLEYSVVPLGAVPEEKKDAKAAASIATARTRTDDSISLEPAVECSGVRQIVAPVICSHGTLPNLTSKAPWKITS